jgi:hypothetical protein
LGGKYATVIVDRLARLAQSMPRWDSSARAAFVRAEHSILAAQVAGWRNQNAWAAWQKVHCGQLARYGQLLADLRFAEIEQMAAQL